MPPIEGPAQRKDVKEQRRDWRIIKALVVGQIVTMILALTGLTIGVLNLSAKADAIQTSRIDSKRDNCTLIKGLAYAAAAAGRVPVVTAFINTTQLANCNLYAKEGITISIPKASNDKSPGSKEK